MAQQPEIKALFEQVENRLNGLRTSAWHEMRKAGLERFLELGIPGKSHEEWRYTPTVSFKNILPHVSSETSYSSDIEAVETAWQTIKGSILHCNNGSIDWNASVVHDEHKELTISSLKQAFEDENEVLSRSFGQIANEEDDAFTALNTAFSDAGIFLHIPKNYSSDLPLVIIDHVNTSEEELALRRDFISVEENAHFKTVDVVVTKTKNFIHHQSEIQVGRGSTLEVLMPQQDHPLASLIKNIDANQEADSCLKVHSLCMDSHLTRNTINTTYKGKNCNCYLNGLFYLNNDEHVDNHVAVRHAESHCTSNQLFKGILDGNSTGVFNGKILVDEDAQLTNAYQTNNNLLLSKSAEINTKPQLEILADDVKCSHGATCGFLDEQALFYLSARGIGPDKARAILTYAFAAELIDEIDIEEAKSILTKRLTEKLGIEALV